MPADIPPSLSHIPPHQLYRHLQPITVDRSSSDAVFENWGRTFKCTPSTIFQPETEYQLELILELTRRERQNVRAVGVGHSPSDLACTSGYMIQMNRMDKIIEVRYRRTRLSTSSYRPCCYPVRSLSLEPRVFSPLKIYPGTEYTNLT
jgi:L-gulonolactone oxidase